MANFEYKHRLIGKVSKCLIHDISTPLSVLSGSIRLLENSKLNKREISNLKKTSLNSLLYIESILDNAFVLLKDSKEERKFFPNCTVRKVHSLMKSRCHLTGIEVQINLKGCKKIYGNESLFARAFLNVLINSIEELERCNKKSKVIIVNSQVKNDIYVLSIKDNGNGVDTRVSSSLVNKEISLKEGKHMGLGMLFVFETVKKYFNGNLTITSKKDQFTQVIFKIPL